MDNQQKYLGLLDTVTQQMLPGFSGEACPIRDLKERLTSILDDCEKIIDADRDDSDYEHM